MHVFNRLPEHHHNKYFTYCLAILINIKNIVVVFAMLAFWDIFVCLGAVHMSRASPANRADSILSRPIVA